VPRAVASFGNGFRGNGIDGGRPNKRSPWSKDGRSFVIQCLIRRPPITSIQAGGDNHARCEITVSDNGLGCDNKYSEKIFDLFLRLYGKSAYEGTGIGLSLCKKIAEQHGGVMRASGKEGEGRAVP
jgi:signal transduction histidine kinase